MRTIKENIVWGFDWDNPFEFEITLSKWINDYNTDYPYQALNNQPAPRQAYENFINNERFTTLKNVC